MRRPISPTRAFHRDWNRSNLTRTVCVLLLWGAVTGAVGPLCFAQSSTAMLSGTVVDEQGGVVPGAVAKIFNPATGFERMATTNDGGRYVFAQLPPGSYDLTAGRDGFSTATFKDLVLNVGDQKTLAIELKVGRVGEIVNVTAEASLVDESPSVATVVDRQFVENLPLNGRSFNSLISITPGVVVTPASSGGEQGQFSVNGQRADTNYFTIDGVSANVGVSVTGSLGQTGAGATPASGATGGTNNLVSIDALQEFRIQTSTFAPEFGRTPGAQVQILTRSGTNDYHGKLYDYFRNDVFDSNDWFANSLNLAKPPLRQNDFGGTLGGPLPLPHFGEGGPYFNSGKNRTFFFFSYEGLRLRQPKVASTNVPSLCTRGRATCPAGVTPANIRLRPFQDAFPVPNGPDFIDAAGRVTGLSEFSASFSNPSTLNATSIRIDHSIGDKLVVFGRFNHAPSSTQVRGGTTRSESLSRISSREFGTDTLTLGTTWAVSTSQSNEFRFNRSRTTASNITKIDNYGGATPPPEDGIFPTGFSSSNALASFAFFSGTSTGAVYFLGLTQENIQRQLNFTDNHSIVHGNHAIKFGVDYRHLSPISGPRGYSQTNQFAVTPTQFNTPTNVIALGNVSSSSIAVSSTVGLFFDNFSLYAQDAWKVNQRLTLTYGTRWEVNPAPTGRKGEEPYAVMGSFDDRSSIAFAPRGTKLWKTTYNNLAPRFGAAYKLRETPGHETVVRGGVGIFYDLGSSIVGLATVNNAFPYSATKTVATGNVYPLIPANSAPPVINTITPATGTQVIVFDPKLKLPRVYQWNFAVEQSLGAKRTFSASYVAAVGRRLSHKGGDRALNANFPGTFTLINNADTSDYHAMQLQFQQRLSGGLQVLSSYTWSHSIDTNSTDFGAQSNIQAISRGPSDFDIRHVFNAAVTYNLPSPSLGSVGNALLRHWSIDTVVTARSATALDVANTAFIGAPISLFLSVRPNAVSGAALYIDDPKAPGGRRINRAAFIAQAAGSTQHGSLGRNSLRAFPLFQTDISLRRELKLTERVKLQLRGEAFNVFNHPNFGPPDVNTGTEAAPNIRFGIPTQMLGRSLGNSGGEGGFNPLYQVGGPRSMQFALKLIF